MKVVVTSAGPTEGAAIAEPPPGERRERDIMIGRPLTLQPCLADSGDVEQGLARPQQEQEERGAVKIGGVSGATSAILATGGSRYYDAAVEPVKQAAHQPDGHDATQGGQAGRYSFPLRRLGLTFDGGIREAQIEMTDPVTKSMRNAIWRVVADVERGVSAEGEG